MQAIWATVITVSMAGCALQDFDTAEKARTKMVGLSKENLLRCAGPPASRATEGQTEVWRYQTGGGTTYSQDVTGQVHGHNSYCIIDIIIVGDAVQSVNYTADRGGPGTVMIGQNPLCARAVRRCVGN
jgi:hypothetical protein